MKYQYYQPNKLDKENNAEDCTVRTLCKLFNLSWKQAFDKLTNIAKIINEDICSLSTLERFFTSQGYYQHYLNGDVTVKEFTARCNKSAAVLTGGHILAVVNNIYFDFYDSGDEYVQSYYDKNKYLDIKYLQPKQIKKEGRGLIMKTRLLKKASNDGSSFSRRLHKEIELRTINGDNNRSKYEQANMTFVIAKRLIADLPLTPTNDLVYSIVDDIQVGLYDDLGTVNTCDNNWQDWLNRTIEILQAQGRLINYNNSISKVMIQNRD